MRVIIVQPSLAKYRVPVYRELSKRPDIDLRVIYATSPGIPNMEPVGFLGERRYMSSFPTPIGIFKWHGAQLKYATKHFCDILILSWDIHYISLIPAIIKARCAGVRVVLWGHGYSKRESLQKRILRDFVGKMADGILLYDKRTANSLVQRGFKKSNVFTAPNTIDQGPIQIARDQWLKIPEELTEFRKKNNLDAGRVILFVSRLDPENRLDLLLSALPEVHAELPNTQVIIIGKGKAEIKRLTKMSENLVDENKVRFIGPIYDEKLLAPWFLISDVFCYPANIGLSLFHAFGYGLPVVTSDSLQTQNPEIFALQHGVNGLTYKQNDYSSLAQTLLAVLSDKAARFKMSQNAYQTSTNEYSLRAMVDGMEAAIKR